MAPYPIHKQTASCNSPHMQPADEFSHGFSCLVWYVEVKVVPIDVIWLFLVKTFARHFVATHSLPSSYPIGVLVVLATPVKTF